MAAGVHLRGTGAGQGHAPWASLLAIVAFPWNRCVFSVASSASASHSGSTEFDWMSSEPTDVSAPRTFTRVREALPATTSVPPTVFRDFNSARVVSAVFSTLSVFADGLERSELREREEGET